MRVIEPLLPASLGRNGCRPMALGDLQRLIGGPLRTGRGLDNMMIVQKGEMLERLSAIIVQLGQIIGSLRGAPAHCPELVRGILAIERALALLETELAVVVDGFQSNKAKIHNERNTVLSEGPPDGISGRWGGLARRRHNEANDKRRG